MKNRIFSLLTVALMALGILLSAGAAELPEDREGTCSIEMEIKYQGTAVKDGKLTAIRVGYMDWDDQNQGYIFRRVSDHVKIENVGSADAVTEMAKYYTEQKDKYEFAVKTAAIQNGTAAFSGLDTGLYLILQKDGDASTGFYPLKEFLVSVPYWDGEEYQYDVDLAVKTALKEIQPDPTEKEDPPSGPKLPQTGQLSWPVPALASCGMLLFAIGWWLYRKGSYEK